MLHLLCCLVTNLACICDFLSLLYSSFYLITYFHLAVNDFVGTGSCCFDPFTANLVKALHFAILV